MKKTLLIVLVVLLLATPLFAASYNGVTKKNSVGVGLNLGTNTGVGMRFGMGDFDIIANVGLANFGVSSNGIGISADAAVSYNVYTLAIEKLEFPVTVGLGANGSFYFGDTSAISIAALVPVGIEYTFDGAPITVYLRLAPGLSFNIVGSDFKLGFGFAGYLGALWNF